MHRVRVLFAGLTMAGLMSGCTAAPFLPILFIQKENEKLLLAEGSPVAAPSQETGSNQSPDQAIAWRVLPVGSIAVRF